MLIALLLLAQDAGKDAGGAGGGGNPFGPLPLFLAIFALFFFLVILPGQRKEKKQREELMTKLKKNDEVVTTSGIIGIVTSIKEGADEVTLKSDETRIRVLRSSIARILTKEAPKEG
jgi:preprotein translocase subunit YajC